MIDKLKILFTLIILLPTAVLFSQSFTASVNSNPVGLNEQFEISFTFSGKDINNLKDFSPPSFNNFLVLSGPNQASSMQIINGAVSASQTFSYYLQTRELGKFTIGSASITSEGKTFKTDPISVEVIKGSPKPKSNQQDESVSNEEIGDNLFIKATADKQKVYLGEQVTVTYKLYTRLNIASQMSVSKLPSYQGFWAEELETSSNIMFSTEVVNGKQYRVGILKKAALFPTQAGDLSVTPFELKIPVQVQKTKKRSNNFFDDFFNDPFFNRETIEYTAKSNTLKVKVNPLPEQNKPDSFSGAVGNFDLSSSIDKSNTKTNEPVSLKINISGTGNIQLINIPEINLPPGVEKYEPKTSEQINRVNKISGRKTVEYLLIPRSQGKKEIDPIKFSYFDLNRNSFVTLTTQMYTINVKQGEGTSDENIAGYSKEDIKLLGDDIRYIKTSTELDKKGEIVLHQFGFWLAVGFPLILLSGLVVWKKRDEKLAGNLQLLRYQKAQKMAKSRLKKAKVLLDSNNQIEFYSEISQALFGYLEDKLHLPKAQFTIEQAAYELENKSIDQGLINNLKLCAEKCEYIRFAPQIDGVAAMNEMYTESANVIIEIEKSLETRKNV